MVIGSHCASHSGNQHLQQARKHGLTCKVVCRSNYGDYFGITVAGYPEAHPEVISDDPKAMEEAYQSDLQYLKKKVGQLCQLALQFFFGYFVFCKWCASVSTLAAVNSQGRLHNGTDIYQTLQNTVSAVSSAGLRDHRRDIIKGHVITQAMSPSCSASPFVSPLYLYMVL